MKKSILLFALMLVCFGIKAFPGNEVDCYIKAGDKIYFGKDIKIGVTHTKIILQDRNVVSIRNRDINMYKHHDKMYMLLPVICDNNDTLCLAMMEYITSKPGINVFRYCCPKNTFAFFLYKDGKFYRRIEADQTEALLALGIKVI